MFSMAIRWGLRADNPCRGIERNQEHKRQRYLTGPELARVTTALANMRDRGAADAIRLMLLTGARRGETLAARWRDIDLEAGVWVKPGSTTKQKTTHRVPLSEAAVRLLTEMRRQAGAEAELLFPAPVKAGPSHRDPGGVARASNGGRHSRRAAARSAALLRLDLGFVGVISCRSLARLLGHSTGSDDAPIQPSA